MRGSILRALTLLLVAGCSVGGGDPAFWTPSQDLGGGALSGSGGSGGGGALGAGGLGQGGVLSGGTTGAGGVAGSTGFGGSVANGGTSGGPNSGACTFHIEFTTSTYNGKYSPKNIGAVWIENGQGQFIKSLDVWAGTRIVHLVKWNAASGGNKVDAITAATATNHGPHSADWNCTDVNENPVSDGPYRLRLEFTEEDSAFVIWPPGPSMSVDFEKGPAPVSATPPDQPNYHSLTLTLD